MAMVRRIYVLLAALCGIGCGAAPEEADQGEMVQMLFATVPYRGVNLAGADFGESALPGNYGTDYIYPDPAKASYFVGKGMNTFRLPFRWERLQRTLGGTLDATELGRLKSVVTGLNNQGAVVLLDPHNYARYNGTLIGSGVSYDQFADFWSKLAGEFKSNSSVIFGLMNEPNTMSTDVWVEGANKAIAAIRNAGASNLILVPGNAWSGAHSWSQNWYGTSNASAMLRISDPGGNYAFEVHQYLDADYSGTASSCVSTKIGSEKLAGFTSWLKTNGKRGFLGEFGGGRDATCAAAIDDAVDHIEANASVWLGWTYWAAGPWWGDYFTTLEPNGSTDRPQMDALESHLTSSTTPTTPTPTTCSPATYEAESMTKSTGGADGTGWNLWSNGYVAQSHAFAAGATTITVTARGTSAAGGWPNLVLSVGGTKVGNVSVNSTSYAPYAFPYTAIAGSKEIRVAFDNDLYSGGEDRNLIVDKVAITCGTTTTPTPTPSCTDGVKNGTETGVDCGGSCAACVVAPSCTDGLKNGTETGVDCGGSCAACVVAPSCTDGVKNGTETGVDCGGSCAACPTSSGSLSGSVKVTNDWGNGYCADLTVKNGGSSSINGWTAVVSTPSATVYTSWNGTYTGASPSFTFKPSADWAAKLGAGASATIGFCANRSSGSAAPALSAVTSP
jgi:endoglucanase